MRGVVFTGGRELQMMEFPDPTPGPGEVVIEMKASGMCGSDLQVSPAEAGAAQGDRLGQRRAVDRRHEPCGVVAALGPGVSDKEAQVGHA